MPYHSRMSFLILRRGPFRRELLAPGEVFCPNWKGRDQLFRCAYYRSPTNPPPPLHAKKVARRYIYIHAPLATSTGLRTRWSGELRQLLVRSFTCETAVPLCRTHSKCEKQVDISNLRQLGHVTTWGDKDGTWPRYRWGKHGKHEEIRLGKDTCNKDAGESFLDRRKLQKKPRQQEDPSELVCERILITANEDYNEDENKYSRGIYMGNGEFFIGGKGDGEIWV